MALLCFGALFGVSANGSDTNSVYQGREFSVATFASYQTDGIVTGTDQWGAGLQADFFLTRNIGLTLASSKTSFGEGGAIQNVAVGPVIRLPICQTGWSPYILGGIGFDFDNGNERYYYGGGGLEYRFTRHVGLFGDAQYVWRDYLVLDRGATVARFGLRWTF